MSDASTGPSCDGDIRGGRAHAREHVLARRQLELGPEHAETLQEQRHSTIRTSGTNKRKGTNYLDGFSEAAALELARVDVARVGRVGCKNTSDKALSEDMDWQQVLQARRAYQ